jgi:hypothetical protein
MRNYLRIIILLFVSLSVNAQSEISFTNKVAYSKSGNINDVRLISLIPAPVSNEYQDISSLRANRGQFMDANATNKVLYFDGQFEDNTLEVFESFKYKTKKIKIDFKNTSVKNIVTGVNPNEYLESDGTYIDLNNATIKQIGDQLWSNSSDILDYAKRCYEYVASHYKYINGSWRSLTEILRIGGGECGDFTTLFVNLMRYKGIPARHNMGVWVNGGYHVWPDFYHEDYGWVPVDPTFKNSNPNGDFFGRYDGDLIILSQGLTTFRASDIAIQNVPLQTYYYWYWYMSGNGGINGVHKTSKDYQVSGIHEVEANDQTTPSIYNLQGIKQTGLRPGINIVNGRKIFMK